MQIEMIQEWIEEVRVGSDGAAEGGCGRREERERAAGMWERGEALRGLWRVSEELAAISPQRPTYDLSDNCIVTNSSGENVPPATLRPLRPPASTPSHAEESYGTLFRRGGGGRERGSGGRRGDGNAHGVTHDWESMEVNLLSRIVLRSVE
ncbi:unnamed protein product [Pleuronectes platessa]|uniref:Uncharacterized protein n=1 Tax=Pleuronectes platessa TaxID=8262 RepID=A0A9N7W490_PLEPL|nr:unnamed protein product [Pleuronectes platessa]